MKLPLELLNRITIFICVYQFLGLFKAQMSEDQDDVCNVYLSDHYVKNNKDFGNIGLDYETSKSYTVNCNLTTNSTNAIILKKIYLLLIIPIAMSIPFGFRYLLDSGLFQLL